MKHLKTFESHTEKEINEEVFGFSKKEKEAKFRKELTKFATAHSRRLPEVTPEIIDAIVLQASKDKFEGKPGLEKTDTGMKLTYRHSEDINWSTKGHSFGSGA